MELQAEQKEKVREWAATGCGLSEIQRRLSEELGITMTFMDVRFLVLELGVEIQDKNRRVEEKTSPATAEAPDGDAGGAGFEEGALEDGVRVEVDRVVKPGALVSGTAVFSDGVQTTWMLDQMGRLALQGPAPDYRPSAEDVQAFQQALQQELAKRGY